MHIQQDYLQISLTCCLMLMTDRYTKKFKKDMNDVGTFFLPPTFEDIFQMKRAKMNSYERIEDTEKKIIWMKFALFIPKWKIWQQKICITNALKFITLHLPSKLGFKNHQLLQTTKNAMKVWKSFVVGFEDISLWWLNSLQIIIRLIWCRLLGQDSCSKNYFKNY